MKLKKIVEKVIDNRGKTPPLVDNGYELLEVNAVNESSRTPDYQKVRKFVSKDTYENWFRTGNITYNDILIPTVGTIGGCCISKQERGSIAQNLIALRINKQIADPDYIFYYFRTSFFKKELLNLDIGGVQPSIKVPHLLNLEISLPPLSEQKRISSILSSFDNKIEQLKKENNILEDIAQSIFKEWFVKYNFPNKDGKPYKNNNGKMINSELGLIPEGWRVGKLADFGEIICGKTPSKKHNEYFNGKYPFIKIPDMTDIFIQETEDSLTEEGAQQLKGKLLPPNSICVSCIATIGKVGITTTDSFTNQQINSIIPKENALEYLYFTLKEMKAFLEQIGNRGSTTFNINTNMFSNLLIPCPPESIILNYHTNASPLFISIQKNMKKIETLLKEKNILLNHLIK